MQWHEVQTADIATVGPSFIPGGGSRNGRVNAWNGMAGFGGGVYMAGVGGHSDWGGNEGYRCNLAVDTPVWEMLSEPSPTALITRDTTHYLDGRPTSSHTYYALHGDVRRQKIFRLGIGSAFGSGNFQKRNVDAFGISQRDWDAANTWPDAPEDIGIGRSQAQDLATGDVYVVGATRLWRFRMESGTWTRLAAIPENGSAAYYKASAVDTRRAKFVVLGNAYKPVNGIMIYDIFTNRWSLSILSGPAAERISTVGGACAFYNARLDKLVFKTPIAGEIILVNLETFEAQFLTTLGEKNVPNAINGVFGKFVALPSLNGYAYLPHAQSKVWFLADS